MENKKINEGPLTPKKVTTSAPITPKKSAASKSWMDPVTSMIDTAKTKYSTPVDKMDQGMPGGTDPGVAQGAVADTYITGSFIYSLLAVAIGAGLTGLGIYRKIRNNKLVKRFTNDLAKNPKHVQRAEKLFNRHVEKMMDLLDKSAKLDKVTGKLEKFKIKNPESSFAMSYRAGALSAEEYSALVELLRKGTELRIKYVKATIDIAIKKYETGKWDWNRASGWINQLPPKYADDIKKAADRVRGIKKGQPFLKNSGTTTSAASNYAYKTPNAQMEAWRNTPIGKKLAPVTGQAATVVKVPTARDFTNFTSKAAQMKSLSANFFDMSPAEFAKKVTTTAGQHWDSWLIRDGYDMYEKIAAASKFPKSFTTITEWPKLSDWTKAVHNYGLHSEIWNDAAAMQKRYLKDKFLWIMSKI